MSLKVKLLFIILTLSIAGLVLSGFYSYHTYKEDKLAYVYESMSEKTEADSRLFSAITEDHEMILKSIVSLTDISDRSSLAPIRAYLESDQRKILGIFAYVPKSRKPQMIVFRGKTLGPETLSWDDLKSAQTGFSLVKKSSGQFLIKKPLGDGGFLAIAFEHNALWGVLKPGEGKSAFFLNANEVISKEKLNFSEGELRSLHPKIVKLPGAQGLIETELSGAAHIVSYSRLGDKDLFLVNVIPSDKLLLIKDVIFKQILSFLILVGSLALFIGTISARWLTLQLDELTLAVREMENENLNVEVTVRSKDELGTLGRAFNTMAGRIRNLLEELRLYNLELEEKVRQRTLELQNLTDIQKGMLNALGQGFVIVDRNYKILPVYSRVSESMFEVNPPESYPGQILGVNEEESQSFGELFSMAFEGKIALEDVTKLAPDKRTNSLQRKIELSYAPVHQGETDNFDYVLIIGTDKTDEYESKEKAKREWEFSQMIQKIASNRFAVNRVLTESLSMMNEAERALSGQTKDSIITAQRLVHTVKGGVSYFFMKEISNACHELESFLSPFLGKVHLASGDMALALTRVKGITLLLEEYIQRFDSIILFSDSKKKRSIEIKDLVRFHTEIESTLPQLAKQFEEAFFWEKLGTFFEIYPEVIQELGQKLGKDIRFGMSGGDLPIPPGQWQEVFGQMIHFVRNSADHGIESPDERTAIGKVPFGTIRFDFREIKIGGKRWLEMKLSDDGRGVDWERMAEKDSSITSLAVALERIKTGGISSKDEVSEFSGRGVGISAIHQSVLRWGGRFRMDSFKNSGFEVTIELPLETEKKIKFKLAS